MFENINFDFSSFKLLYHFKDEEGETKWSRDCTHNVNKTIGCQKRSWPHDGQETIIDECICDKDLCNKDMEAITSSTAKTTTTNGRQNYIK